jgi:ATP-dependent DNA ligase
MTIKPMLAVPQSKAHITDWKDWAIEKKFDGHRLVVHVEPSPDGHRFPNEVHAWTRPRKHAADPTGKTMVRRDLPPHLLADLARLPVGVYDGELLAGIRDATATDVTRTDLADTLYFVVFDVMRTQNWECMGETYEMRRVILSRIFRETPRLLHVQLAESKRLTCEQDVVDFVAGILEGGGEGAILKRLKGRYQQGKRSTDFVKIKRKQHATLRVVAFEPTRGKVMNRGLFASVCLQDADGNETSCKTKDDAEIAAFQREWDALLVRRPHIADQVAATQGRQREILKVVNTYHPALGRELVVEFPMRTRTGGYQGPVIWDRWEDE